MSNSDESYNFGNLIMGLQEYAESCQRPELTTLSDVKIFTLSFLFDGKEYPIVGTKVIDNRLCFVADPDEFVRVQIDAMENGHDILPDDCGGFTVMGET